jgi:hypothetical protein
MKHLIRFLLLVLISTIANTTHCLENFDISLKSKWQELDNNCERCTNFGGKWVVVGSITFEKRAKDPIAVETINLHWCGDHLDNLIASLYRKIPGKDFLAIEHNLVCDGIWNEKKQTLIFDFDEKQNLGPTTVFYLVLTMPSSIEPILKNGYFCLENDCLPRPFKHSTQNEKLFLAINDTPAKNIFQHTN